MFKKAIIFVFVLIVCFNSRILFSQKIDYQHRIRIAEAMKIAVQLGNKLWPDWDKAPFAILLIKKDYEYLINYPSPPEDFKLIGYDSLLKSNVYYRPRQLNINLFATMYPVGSVPTVVAGTPQNTGYSGPHWTITLLHEHFHQLQYTHEDYQSGVNSLNLSKGDNTGMWMLNYAFPYDSLQVQAKFEELCKELSTAMDHLDSEDLPAHVQEYLKVKDEFKNILNTDDYNYFSFQLWQEGIARYTEYSIAKLASAGFIPDDEFRSLTDYDSFKSVADSMLDNIKKGLKELTLSGYKRVAFYYIGSAEGLLLDKINHDWKDMYFKNKFYLERYYK